MDPNEALRQIRKALATIRRIDDEEDPNDYGDYGPTKHALEERDMAVDSLVEHVEALDDWMTSGGFAPSGWSRPVDVHAKKTEVDNGR